MTSNLKGVGRTKLFVLRHGEKFAIGFVGLLTLVVVYQSFRVPRLDEDLRADALQKEISQTSNDVQGYTWATALGDQPRKVRQSESIALNGSFDLDPGAYVVGGDPRGKKLVGFDMPIVAPMAKRTDPPILNVSKVVATGGTGLLSFVDDEIRKQRQLQLAEEAAERDRAARTRPGQPVAQDSRTDRPYDPEHPKRRPIDASLRIAGVPLQGDERIERAYWACVVALVPVRDQLMLYQDSFEKARGYDAGRDFPRYLGFYAERAEVVAGKMLDWRPVAIYDGQRKSIAAHASLSSGPQHAIGEPVVNGLYVAVSKFWAGGGSPEVVDERGVQRLLTLPLPPLVGRNWESDATHPAIRFRSPPVAQAPETATTDAQPKATDSDFGDAGLGVSNAGSVVRNSSGLGGRGFAQSFAGQREVPGYLRNGVASGLVGASNASVRWGVDHYLLRFFDFTVEPGKTYKYRVKLVVADPNYNLPARTLEPAVLDRQAAWARASNGKKPTYRLAETWSDPSPAAGIPMDGIVRLADVHAPSAEKVNSEPSARLSVSAFAIDEKGNAIQAGIELKDVRRGEVLNFLKDTEYVGPGYIDTRENFSFRTGTTVLDIRGGEKLTREMHEPSKILLMGPAGQLTIHNDVDDKPDVDHQRRLFAKPIPSQREPGRPTGKRPG